MIDFVYEAVTVLRALCCSNRSYVQFKDNKLLVPLSSLQIPPDMCLQAQFG
jgi:hypothetical protein